MYPISNSNRDRAGSTAEPESTVNLGCLAEDPCCGAESSASAPARPSRTGPAPQIYWAKQNIFLPMMIYLRKRGRLPLLWRRNRPRNFDPRHGMAPNLGESGVWAEPGTCANRANGRAERGYSRARPQPRRVPVRDAAGPLASRTLIRAEVWCYTEVKAPYSYTRTPRSTEIPCYSTSGSGTT